MKDEALAAIGIAAVLGVTFGLHATVKQQPMAPSKPFVAAEKSSRATTAKPKDDSKVVLTVNGETVTEQEFMHFVEQMVPEDQRPMVIAPAGAGMRREIAEQIIQRKIFEQKARELGLDQEAGVQEQLKLFETEILFRRAIEKLVTPTEAELRAEYAKHSGEMQTVDLSSILIAYQGGGIPARGGNAPTAEQAMQKASAIVARLRAGANFEQLAMSESDEVQSAQRGGHMGPVPAGALGAELAPKVAALKEGQVSDPIPSSYGVFIFKVGKRETRSYAEVRPMIEQRMKQERVQATIQRELAAAKVDRDKAFFGEPSATPPQMPPTQPQGGKS